MAPVMDAQTTGAQLSRLFGHIKRYAPFSEMDPAAQMSLVERAVAQGASSLTPAERQIIEDSQANRMEELRRLDVTWDSVTQQRID